jgi:hypothetical protein
MTPAIIILEDHVSGDTWQGVPVIGPIQILSGETLTNFPYPIASVRLNISRIGGHRVSLTLASSGTPMAPITITDVDTWELVIPPVAPSVWTPPDGDYQGHFEVTDSQDTIITIYDVRFTVLPDKTR